MEVIYSFKQTYYFINETFISPGETLRTSVCEQCLFLTSCGGLKQASAADMMETTFKGLICLRASTPLKKRCWHMRTLLLKVCHDTGGLKTVVLCLNLRSPFSHCIGRPTCFWPGGGEGSQGQQSEGTQSSELSHLHPDDSDLADSWTRLELDQTARERG